MNDYRLHADRYLTNLADKKDEELTSAVEAWALSDALSGGDVALCRDWWPRLVGRPAGLVREHSRQIRQMRPEMRQNAMTQFAKDHPAKPRRSA